MSPLPCYRIPDLAVTVTITEAIRLFQDYARASRDPSTDRRLRLKHVPESSEQSILSDVRAAFRAAAHSDGGDFGERPCNAFLLDLPVIAKRLRGAPARSRVTRFVEAITGMRWTNKSMWAARRLLPEAYVPLVSFFSLKQDEANLNRFARIAQFAGGDTAPRRLPSFTELEAAGDRLEIARNTQKQAFGCYRRLRREWLASAPTEAAAFDRLPIAPRGNLLTLEEVGFTLEPGQDSRDAIRALAPKLYEQTDFYCTKGHGAKCSEAWRDQVWMVALQIVGMCLRHEEAELLPSLEYLHLVELTRSGDNGADADPFAVAGSEGDALLPLLRWLIDREAPRAVARSPFRDHIMAAGAQYTRRVHSIVTTVWAVVEKSYGPKLRDKQPTRWANLKATFDTLDCHIRTHCLPDEQNPLAKNKLKMIRTITYPIVVCVVLPLLERTVRAAEDAWRMARDEAVAAGHNPDRHKTVRAAFDAMESAALDYLVVAIPIDDGKRLKNYKRMLVGPEGHFRPTLDANGTVTGATICFTRLRTDRAHLKDTKGGKGKPPRRLRRLRPGIVSPYVLDLYLRAIRPVLIPHARTRALRDVQKNPRRYTLTGEMLPFFLSRHGAAGELGGFAGATLSDRFGAVLHRACREWLGRDLPAWDELGEDWRELWSMHVSRLLLATYWGAVRGHWDVGCELTDDLEETLRSEYQAPDFEMKEELAGEETWESPHAFDRWMDDIYHRFAVPDLLKDPRLPLPDPVRVLLNADRQTDSRERDRNLRRRRIRKARPGQRLPSRPAEQGGELLPAA